ncbi:MAG: hypothetical protein ACFCU6_03785 [Balneolaceae bacterium]
MLKPMFGHRPKPRKFDMPLRYYDPKDDERRKKRIHIKMRRRRDKQGIKIVLYALGLALVVWLITVL